MIFASIVKHYSENLGTGREAEGGCEYSSPSPVPSLLPNERLIFEIYNCCINLSLEKNSKVNYNLREKRHSEICQSKKIKTQPSGCLSQSPITYLIPLTL